MGSLGVLGREFDGLVVPSGGPWVMSEGSFGLLLGSLGVSRNSLACLLGSLGVLGWLLWGHWGAYENIGKLHVYLCVLKI